ncbi:MAG: lysylphosphatidylglycerol synthase transmembrane domain-containing protein [Caldilineaceae bacterium]
MRESIPLPETISATDAQSWLRLDRKRLLVLGVLGLLTLALMVTLGGGRQALNAMLTADWRLVGLAILIHYSGFAVRGARWRRLLQILGYRLPYLYTTNLLIGGWFISALTPARAGDFVRIGLLNRPLRTPDELPSIPVAVGTSSLVLERSLDILAILGLGGAFGLTLLRGKLPATLLWAYGAGLLLMAFFIGALFVSPRLLEWMNRWWDHALWRKALDFAAQLVESLRTLPTQPAAALFVLLESLYIWLCDALLLWLVLLSIQHGTDAAVTFGGAAFVALTVDVFATIPLLPGGIGQIESAYAGLLALFALSSVNISAVVLLTRAISYWSFLIFSGLVTFAAGLGQVFSREKTNRSTDYTDFRD